MPDGPAIFKQERIGKYGKPFKMYKFRTMKSYYNSLSSVTVKGEERITSTGRFLRKYKLDELPELYNVLKGDMSFVGPRPDVPGYADKLKDEYRKILEFKPGITGPATLKYRNEEELLAKQNNPIEFNDNVIFPDKVRINLNYVKKWKFWLDVKILFYTLTGQTINDPDLN